MAKVNVTVDTETNSLEVSINGTRVEDAKEFMAYMYDGYDNKDKVSFQAISHSKDESGVHKRIYLTAKDSNKIKSGELIAKANLNEEIVVAVESDNSELDESIKTLLSNKE